MTKGTAEFAKLFGRLAPRTFPAAIPTSQSIVDERFSNRNAIDLNCPQLASALD
jgi:hypothetical protein